MNENAYTTFWQWFQQHQQHFYHIVDQGSKTEIERDFFDRLTPELEKVHSGIFFLTGMLAPQTAELILTPDGIIPNIVFVEELIAAAPEIAGWKFTALKPESDIHQVGINTFKKYTTDCAIHRISKYESYFKITGSNSSAKSIC